MIGIVLLLLLTFLNTGIELASESSETTRLLSFSQVSLLKQRVYTLSSSLFQRFSASKSMMTRAPHLQGFSFGGLHCSSGGGIDSPPRGCLRSWLRFIEAARVNFLKHYVWW